MSQTRFDQHVRRLMDLMDEGNRALAGQDLDGLTRSTDAMTHQIDQMTDLWTETGGLLSVQERAVAERLGELLRAALARVEASQRGVRCAMEQTQDALRVMQHAREAIGCYADGLGAHRRELFDLSA